jgi:dTDP-4-dehydrorhamnose reductase
MAALRILVTGASGFLGPFVVEALRAGGHEVSTTGRRAGDAQVDLLAAGMVGALCEALAPDFVCNLAAMSRLADCERDPAAARRTNALLPGELAARFGDRLLHVSTDLVFDGRTGPYDEGAAVGPLSVYGATKAEGEDLVRQRGGRVARLPLLFGSDAQGRGASSSLRVALSRGERAALFTNEYRTPLHALDAARGIAELLTLRRCPQLVHLPGPERCSRWELGRRLCALHGLDADRLSPVECQDPLRPRDVSLAGVWAASRSLNEMLADA